MTVEEARTGLKRLQASYHGMAKLDELTVSSYLEEIGSLRWDDFAAGAKECVRNTKFFPSIAEILSFAEDACRKRIAIQDREEREERLALQAGEDRIMDPKSDVHRVIVGPNHAKFLELLKTGLPEPEWAKRKKVKA